MSKAESPQREWRLNRSHVNIPAMEIQTTVIKNNPGKYKIKHIQTPWGSPPVRDQRLYELDDDDGNFTLPEVQGSNSSETTIYQSPDSDDLSQAAR